eukprot:4313616-Prymnesium_polylepis.1
MEADARSAPPRDARGEGPGPAAYCPCPRAQRSAAATSWPAFGFGRSPSWRRPASACRGRGCAGS